MLECWQTASWSGTSYESFNAMECNRIRLAQWRTRNGMMCCYWRGRRWATYVCIQITHSAKLLIFFLTGQQLSIHKFYMTKQLWQPCNLLLIWREKHRTELLLPLVSSISPSLECSDWMSGGVWSTATLFWFIIFNLSFGFARFFLGTTALRLCNWDIPVSVKQTPSWVYVFGGSRKFAWTVTEIQNFNHFTYKWIEVCLFFGSPN